MSHTRKAWHRLVASCVTATLFASMLCAPAAYAEDAAAQSAREANQLVEEIEQATKAYQDATARVDDLANQIAQNESHAAEIEQALPAQRDLAAKSIKQLYIFHQSSPGLLDLLLSAESFNQFITALEYIDAIHDHNTTQVTALQSMYDDLTQTKSTLSMELDAAQQKQGEALQALDIIRTSLASLQQRAASTTNASSNDRQEASSALQEAQEIVSTLPEPVAQAVSTPSEPAAQEQESKPEDKNKQEDEEQKTGEQTQPEAPAEQDPAPTEPDPVPVESETPAPEVTAPANTEVSSWAARIDAYLSSYGAPLAGHGATFAQAALDYGVDPRISPAISIIESGGGKVCFLPHNAWGWGTASWRSCACIRV